MASIQKRIGKDGKSTWRVRIRKKGFPAISQSFRYKADAERWASKVETEINDGVFFAKRRKQERTLDDAIVRYSRDEAQQLADRANRIRQLNWWGSEIGAYSLLQLCGDVDLVHDALQKLRGEEIDQRGRRRGPATIKRYLAALSRLFSCAMNWGWCDANPIQRIQKPSEPNGRDRFLSDSERKTLLKATSESSDPYLHTVVLMALSTGARYGEIMGLTWPDVSFDRETVTFRGTKNGEIRSCPITPEVHSRLRNLRKVRILKTDLVFPRYDGKKPKSVRAAWDKAVREANLDDFRFHDLRHTAASYLAMTGATPTELAAILGHKSLSMVARYAHVSKQHSFDLIERMTERFALRD